MRILALSRSTLDHPGWGGMELVGHRLLQELNHQGHVVECLSTAHRDGKSSIDRDGIHFHFLEGTTPGAYSSAWFADSSAWIAGLPGERRPDVIFSQSGSARGYMLGSRKELHIPAVALFHGVGVGHLKAAWRTLRFPRGLGHLFRVAARCAYERLLEPKGANDYETLIVISREMVEEAVSHLKVDRSRVVFIPNGVDTHRFRFDPAGRKAYREKLDIDPEAPVLLMASRCEWIKGLQYGIEAMALPELEGARMVIAGRGPYAPELEALIEARGLTGRVLMVGHVSREDLPGFYSSGDVFLFPSMMAEGLPTVLLEAMSCELPLVATPAGGTPTLMSEGENGVWIPFKDPSATARAAASLLQNKEDRVRLGQAGRAWAVREFDQQRVLTRMAQVVTQAASK